MFTFNIKTLLFKDIPLTCHRCEGSPELVSMGMRLGESGLTSGELEKVSNVQAKLTLRLLG